jgi:ABC-type transport system involved in cytochrome bd biosynthesis fused ATPase/permease subunit
MDEIKIWLPPMLTLLGTLIVVTFTAWYNTRSVHALIEALRQEVRANMAEAFAPVNLALQRLENKLDHYAEVRATHSEQIDELRKKRG